MLQSWSVIAVALGYIGLLFLVATYGDRTRRADRPRLLIYPLSLAIYCTSWTFFGSVGLASRTGYDFLTIYIGPVVMLALGYPLILRIVRLAKAQNITSIADFIAARYGKHQAVAATVASIAIIGSIPYIALQLKAVSSSLGAILAHTGAATGAIEPALGDLALFIALTMAAFAMLFGTRHIDAAEHQDGLMLAIATESIIKLIAFVAVGVFVTFVMFDGPWGLFREAMARPDTAKVLTTAPTVSTWVAMTLLSFVAIVLLPRQFHVTVVENRSEGEVRRAAWLFPLYLVLINLFVVPIAIAGLLTFGSVGTDSDMFVLALPLHAGSDLLGLAAFIGGLSAATAMVIVESVALAIMASNDLVMPLILRRSDNFLARHPDVGAVLLQVRRGAIAVILVLAYLYYRSTGDVQLASIGLLSFAAVAQLAPVFFGGLVWRRATARGALAGLIAGIAVWFYTLLLPTFVNSGLFGPDLLTNGPFDITALRPQALFGVDLPPLAHGVAWSLAVNIIAYVAFSFAGAPASIEQLQAETFVPAGRAPMTPSFRLWRESATVEELIATVSRYLGEERTRSAFASFAATRRLSLDPKREADFELLRYAEHLLASGIGAASSRLVLSLLLRKRMSSRAALKLLDDASAAIHYNREILQSALDHVRQGIAVFDKDLHLVCWNRQFGEILDLPPHDVRVGVNLADLLAHQRGGRRVRAGRARRAGARAAFTLRLRQRAIPGALSRARAGGRGAQRPDAGLRHRDHAHRHHPERRRRGGAGARQRVARGSRARAHPRARAAQCRADPRQGRGRRRQYFQDAVSGGREPRHSAAAQRRAALCDEPGRAPARGRRSRAGRQRRRLARGGGGNSRGAARYLAARHRRHEAGDRKPAHRRAVPPARGRLYAARPRQGAGAQIHRLLAHGALGPAAAAPAAAEPRLQRDQVHAQGPRADRLPAARRARDDRHLRHRHRDSEVEAADHLRRVQAARRGRESGARAWPRAFDRGAHRAHARPQDRAFLRGRARLAFFRAPADCARARGRAGAAHAGAQRRQARRACTSFASTTNPRCSTAWRRCSPAGAAGSARRRIWKARSSLSRKSGNRFCEKGQAQRMRWKPPKARRWARSSTTISIAAPGSR